MKHTLLYIFLMAIWLSSNMSIAQRQNIPIPAKRSTAVDSNNPVMSQSDSISFETEASWSEGMLSISLCTSSPASQLSFLMQGLTLSVSDENSRTEIAFPCATAVKDKVKRHPNEVKPTFDRDSIGTERRPDLQPLVAALNDTTATLSAGDIINTAYRQFAIVLNREERTLYFTTTIPYHACDSIMLEATSMPSSVASSREEFDGKKLSTESRHNKGGLGQAPISHSDVRRNIRYVQMVTVLKQETIIR